MSSTRNRHNIQLAAFYFPDYHCDERMEKEHGPGWTEWDVVQAARSRFPGHRQPKVPLWGYGDESEPEVMAKKIDAAADHGIGTFLFDWYWYGEKPFLEGALKRGFLNALAEFNIPLSDFFIEHGAFREEDGYLTTRKFLSERPDALICSDDQQLLGAFRAIQEAGLHVPEEIALACSNHSMFIKIAVPKITLIDIFPEKLGTAAAEKLIAIISGKKTENATILDAELIPGN